MPFFDCRNRMVRFWKSHSLLSTFFFGQSIHPMEFFSCCVGHGWNMKYFRNCRPWYPISRTELLNQKRHSRSSRNQFEPIFYLLHDIFWSVVDPEGHFWCMFRWYKKPGSTFIAHLAEWPRPCNCWQRWYYPCNRWQFLSFFCFWAAAHFLHTLPNGPIQGHSCNCWQLVPDRDLWWNLPNPTILYLYL